MKKILFNVNYTNDEVNIIQDTLKKKTTLLTKFTQKEIAEMMGAKQPQVSNWLNGKRIPTASNLMRLADILDEYPEDLLDKLEKIKQENNF
jgi:transcriptional regulator with XRE-family HTH domain